MLRALDIRNILIIDHLDLAFQPGLNVLTGETGAGKSILLDSLGFVLGWRGRAELVRQGADQGEVTAVFDLPEGHGARAVLDEAGLPQSDELILRRVNTRDGRKTAWVNDRRCSGEVLRRLSDTLLELHGQQDDRGLLDPRGHRLLLDAYGRLDGLKSDTRTAWRGVAAAQKALEAAEAALHSVRAEEDFLRHAVAELDALDPQPGEDEALDTRRRLMQQAERICEDITRAQAALGQEGAEGAAGDALRWLEGVAPRAETQLDAPIAALGRAMVELDEAAQGVARCLEALTFNPIELEETEERLFAIRALARKHGVGADDLGDFAGDLRARLASLDQGDADLEALRQSLRGAQQTYDAAATALSRARAEAATALDRAMRDELAPLKMERAAFTTAIIATDPGAPAAPLNKIASGGELSRFLLALKVCLTGTESGLTMIFDEIDRGVGGATADAVGRRLSQLAETGQVLVVTHSPQVAARGGHHWRVEKKVQAERTLSTVTPLDAAARRDEIARMLSGEVITDEARAAAEALMAG